MRAPDFWQDPGSPIGRLLAPLGWLYGATTRWRLAHGRPWRAPVPVVCVGNLTAGGTGKTPIVRDLATRLIRSGRRPHILSRGHGGRALGPLRVDPGRHDAAEVGDEPLLLARDAPCWVSADRAAGARAIVAAGGEIIILDDGFQNPGLVQDLKIVVIDGRAGFGNGRLIPAGPLREPVASGLARADAIVIMGDDRPDVAPDIAGAITGRAPILRASLETLMAGHLGGSKLVGFAGIGRPEKFRATLVETGAEVAGFHAFSDHHPYRTAELEALAAEAGRSGATLATTEKDWVRLPAPWRDRVRAIPVIIHWRDEALAIEALIERIEVNG